jgi:hypothetical protein
MILKLCLFSCLLMLSTFLNGQINHYYLTAIRQGKINEKIVVDLKSIRTEFSYQGEILLGKGKSYFVVAETYNYQVSPTNHGFNNILFIDTMARKPIQYEVDFDYQLPMKLDSNKLTFKSWNVKTQKFEIFESIIKDSLPKILCCGQNQCFTRFDPSKKMSEQ